MDQGTLTQKGNAIKVVESVGRCAPMWNSYISTDSNVVTGPSMIIGDSLILSENSLFRFFEY